MKRLLIILFGFFCFVVVVGRLWFNRNSSVTIDKAIGVINNYSVSMANIGNPFLIVRDFVNNVYNKFNSYLPDWLSNVTSIFTNIFVTPFVLGSFLIQYIIQSVVLTIGFIISLISSFFGGVVVA